MTEDTHISQLAGIQRISHRIALMIGAAFWLLIPIVVAYVLLFPEQLPYNGWVAMAKFQPRPLSALMSAAVIAVFIICAMPAMYGLWHLRKLFEAYAAGQIFTVKAARRLRYCSLALLASAAVGPIGSAGLSGALSIGLEPGTRTLVIGFSGNDLAFALIGTITLVIGRIMEQAAHIAADNAGFV